MKSLKLFAATALLFAAGVGLYQRTEVANEGRDRPTDPVATQPSITPIAIAPNVPIEVQVDSTPADIAAPDVETPAPEPFRLSLEPIATNESPDIKFDPATPDMAQIDRPSTQGKAVRHQIVSPGLFSISTSNTFIVPTVGEGDRTPSVEVARNFDVTAIDLDVSPSVTIGIIDPFTETQPSGSPPPALTDPLEDIDLLKPTSPDPLDSAKRPDTSVPEPGTVAGLLVTGLLGAGAIARRKLAKRYS